MSATQTYHLLAVDDDPIVRELLMLITKTNPNFKAKEASNGKDALRIIQEETFDLVLLDLNMPQMDGLQVLEELGKASEPPPKVIIISAFAQDEMEKLKETPFVKAVVHKPYKINDLKKVVDEVLAQ